MPVTRTRLASPPSAPSPPATIAADPVAEARQDRDRLKVIGYFAGRAGQWRTAAQIVVGAGLPIGRAYEALDQLVASGWLIKDNEHPTRAGVTTPAWIRPDRPAGRE